MMKRDLELLSAYLDGELRPSDSTKLEARLKTDPELVSVLDDLRAARILLRKLPSRKAPRNFTLTRKMVGQNPPLPRSYPLFRYASVVATLLLFLTFGLNSFGSQLASQSTYGIGGSGGGNDTELFSAEAPMLEAPAEEMSPLPTLTLDTQNGEPPAALAPPQSTEVAPAQDSTRILETPVLKNGETENAVEPAQLPAEKETPLVPRLWQIVFGVTAVVSAIFMGLMRQLSARRWK